MKSEASISYKMKRDNVLVNEVRIRIKNYVMNLIVDLIRLLPWQPSPDEVETLSFYPSGLKISELESRLCDIVDGKISLKNLRVRNLSHPSKSNMDFSSPI